LCRLCRREGRRENKRVRYRRTEREERDPPQDDTVSNLKRASVQSTEGTGQQRELRERDEQGKAIRGLQKIREAQGGVLIKEGRAGAAEGPRKRLGRITSWKTGRKRNVPPLKLRAGLGTKNRSAHTTAGHSSVEAGCGEGREKKNRTAGRRPTKGKNGGGGREAWNLHLRGQDDCKLHCPRGGQTVRGSERRGMWGKKVKTRATRAGSGRDDEDLVTGPGGGGSGKPTDAERTPSQRR